MAFLSALVSRCAQRWVTWMIRPRGLADRMDVIVGMLRFLEEEQPKR